MEGKTSQDNKDKDKDKDIEGGGGHAPCMVRKEDVYDMHTERQV